MIPNDRLSKVLEECIEEYIRSAAPVSSSTLSQRMEREQSPHARSPATLRNELRVLEDLGYLHQVHSASGGRIPTSLAYAEYMKGKQAGEGASDGTFVGGLIEDLYRLTVLINRIENKLGGIGSLTNPTGEDINRRVNIYNLFRDPNLHMSAIYLIIKEKLK